MKDPQRLLDGDADEFESELLRSVKRDSMTKASRRRILAGLGVGGAIFTTSAVAGSSALGEEIGFFKGASLLAAKWIAICSAVALVPAGIWVADAHRSQSSANAPLPSPAVVAHPVPVAVADGPEAKRPADGAVVVRAPPPRDPKPAARPARPRSAPSPATLGDEVVALQAARMALANQDSSGALAGLDRYRARFPSGRLTPEATVLRIEALLQRGDRSQAAALAAQFSTSTPDSPYAERIESMLARAKAKSSR